MNNKLTTIDPNQGNIPDAAIIQKVVSENDRLPNSEHEKAVKAFYFSDSIASGIGKDFAFVEKIPQLISDIIDNKSWECLYVSRGVVTPYYCRYTKGTDSENFRAFIAAKRPNGLGTTIETIDRLLEAETEVQWKFRTIVYESRQGERNDLSTSGLEVPKLELGDRQQKRIRAAERAGEAIPEIRELLDRGLIAISIAAELGRDIKDSDNLTAEEREYVDKRDLVGLRIKEYINTNIIPEDEDKEPAYSRKINEFVKDLLGIKNRSKAVRMDNPKKAAEKLLQFYEGQKLKELLEYLNKGLDDNLQSDSLENSQNSSETNSSISSSHKNNSNGRIQQKNNSISQQTSPIFERTYQSPGVSSSILSSQKLQRNQENSKEEEKVVEDSDSTQEDIFNQRLTQNELAERFKLKSSTIADVIQKRRNKFTQWSQGKDPEGIGWTRTQERRGRSFLFAPVQKNKEEEIE